MYDLAHQSEYYAIRSAAALFDISPLHKYHIRGRDALKLLNRVVTRHVAECARHQVFYTPWCDEHGKVIDDGTLSHLDQNLYRLTAADPNLRWLLDNATGLQVQVEDVSEHIAAVALQGPTSGDILEQLGVSDLGGLKYFRQMRATVGGIPADVTRTGYTGDLGYEIWVEAQEAIPLWDALMEAGAPYKMRPSGTVALEIARIEAGLLLIEVDFISARKTLFEVQKSSPFELGLGWTVNFEKDYFVGREALLQEKQRGPTWITVGLEVQWEALEEIFQPFGMPPQFPDTAWITAVPVYANGQQIGKATSGTWSPVLKKNIALARIRPEYGRVGSQVAIEVTAEAHRRRAAATVVKRPFFDPPRKKA
jgi:aminomethyltransferase